MNPSLPYIIGCETVINELRSLLPKETSCRVMEPGLHMNPQRLQAAVQDAIDQADGQAEAIVLAYGLCSNAVIGIHAQESTLIVPRAHDCIAMMLGSQSAYKRELRKAPGTYFLSKGWIDAGITLVEESRDIEKRYGKSRAEWLRKKMFGHYTRLAFIDMGHKDQQPYRDFARQAALEFELTYEEIQGTTKLLKQLIRGPWDNSFICAEPGRVIRLDDFGMFSPKESDIKIRQR